MAAYLTVNRLIGHAIHRPCTQSRRPIQLAQSNVGRNRGAGLSRSARARASSARPPVRAGRSLPARRASKGAHQVARPRRTKHSPALRADSGALTRWCESIVPARSMSEALHNPSIRRRRRCRERPHHHPFTFCLLASRPPRGPDWLDGAETLECPEWSDSIVCLRGWRGGRK